MKHTITIKLEFISEDQKEQQLNLIRQLLTTAKSIAELQNNKVTIKETEL